MKLKLRSNRERLVIAGFICTINRLGLGDYRLGTVTHPGGWAPDGFYLLRDT